MVAENEHIQLSKRKRVLGDCSELSEPGHIEQQYLLSWRWDRLGAIRNGSGLAFRVLEKSDCPTLVEIGDSHLGKTERHTSDNIDFP